MKPKMPRAPLILWTIIYSPAWDTWVIRSILRRPLLLLSCPCSDSPARTWLPLSPLKWSFLVRAPPHLLIPGTVTLASHCHFRHVTFSSLRPTVFNFIHSSSAIRVTCPHSLTSSQIIFLPSRNILIILLDDFNITPMVQPFTDLFCSRERHTHDHNLDFVINKHNLYILVCSILLTCHYCLVFLVYSFYYPEPNHYLSMAPLCPRKQCYTLASVLNLQHLLTLTVDINFPFAMEK